MIRFRPMPILRFGAFEIDEDARELRCQGRRIHVAAQPLKTLMLLVRRPGQVVTRDELRHNLWGDSTFVEFDRGINFCVASLRTALNDDARKPRFIETVPRVGYRFLADVRHEETRSPAEDAGSPSNEVEPGGSRRQTSHWSAWARRAGCTAAALMLIAQLPTGRRAHTRATATPASRAAFERGLREAAQGLTGARRSVHEFREAISLDSRFAEAHFALAEMYLKLVDQRELPASEALAEAQSAALEAVTLEDMPETRVALATARLAHDWDWRGARSDVEAALRLAPNWDFGLVAYARLLSGMGEDREALAAIDRAETLSPSCDLLLLDSGILYYRARRFDVALDKLRGAVIFGPPRGLTRELWQQKVAGERFFVHAARHDWSGAQADAAEIMWLQRQDEVRRQRFLALDPFEATRRFAAGSAESMSNQPMNGRGWSARIARMRAVAQESGPALDSLERAAAERDLELPCLLRNPEFDFVRSYPRFKALAARLGVPQQDLAVGTVAAARFNTGPTR